MEELSITNISTFDNYSKQFHDYTWVFGQPLYFIFT